MRDRRPMVMVPRERQIVVPERTVKPAPLVDGKGYILVADFRPSWWNRRQ